MLVDRETRTISVTTFGETRDVEFRQYGEKFISTHCVLIGRFPTGTKLHRTDMDLWKRNTTYTDPTTGEVKARRPVQGPTAAVVDGEEYVMGTTLYIHNSNRGRICGWNDEKWNALLAKWR